MHDKAHAGLNSVPNVLTFINISEGPLIHTHR